MKVNKAFRHIQYLGNRDKFVTVGKKVDYTVEVSKREKKIRLYFQESNGFLDWWFNLKYFTIKYKKVYNNQITDCLKAHSGFVKAYKSANDIIMAELLIAITEHPGYEVIIIGWSHGGALTQLAAEDLNYRTRSDKSDVNTGVKPRCVTFGSPIVFIGDAVDYVKSCCSEFTEIAQHNDVVSYLPPFKRFKHLTDIKRIGEEKKWYKLFNPMKYHTEYGSDILYEGTEFEKMSV